MKWFKVYAEMIDDPKLRLLSFEDRWHYVALLCCKADGIQDEVDGLWEELLRVKLGLAQAEFDSLKKRLLKVSLIDESWNPKGWEKRQAAKDPLAAERQRKYRENQKKRNVTHNVTATSRVEEEVEEEREEETTTTSPAKAGNRAPVQQIVDLYHEILPANPRVVKITPARRSLIKQRWNDELKTLDNWRNYFEHVAQSNFLTGRAIPQNGKPVFFADLEWLVRPSNLVKVAEGKYHREVTNVR